MRTLARCAFVLTALVPLFVGCGAKQSALDGSADAMSDAGSSRVEIRATSGGKIIFVTTGTFDYKRDVGEMELRVLPEQDEPSPDVLRLIGRTVFTGWTIAGKRRWQKEEAFTPTDAQELILPFEGGPPPDRVLELLLKTSTKTEILGSDKIRGVSARHHRLHVDEDAILREFGIENALDNHVSSKIVVEAWVDDDKLLRRLVFPESNEAEGERVTFDFFDFGVEVDVKAPPADEIITEDEFSRLMEKECLQKKLAREDICAMMAGGESSMEGPTETMPRTITEPSK